MPKQRWYKGFSYRGKPEQLIEQISKQVHLNHLSEVVPLLRLEKGAKPRKPFYFFLAIESQQIGDIPPNLSASNLLNLPFFKTPAVKRCYDFTYEQIKSMVGAAHQVEDYTNPIPYQLVEPLNDYNPFDFIASTPSQLPTPDIKALSEQYDRLLYWLSAMGSGTWESFKKACEALQLPEPKRILRRLKLLGHMESSPDGKRWSVAPTALVKINSQSSEFILCGQRSIDLLEHLQKYAQLTYIHQPGGAAPHCIRLKVSDPKKPGFGVNSGLKSLTSARNPVSDRSDFTVINVGEASLQLAELLPDIKIWQEHLTSLPGIVPSIYQWQKFNCQTNQFEESYPGETGLYELRRETNQNYRRTLFYDRERDAWLQGDWYGLRFIALHYSGQQCLACYNSDRNRLAIQDNQRWPEIYERALVLASGFLPTDYKTQQSRWLIYENIGKELVQKLVKKLHLTCEED